MKRKRYAGEEVAFALRQAEGGTPVAEVCRKMGVSEPTFFRWEKRFAGMGVGRDPAAQAARGREHEAEAPRGRPDAGQDHAAGRAAAKAVRPAVRRDVVRHLQGAYAVSERRACHGLPAAVAAPPLLAGSADGAARAPTRLGRGAGALRPSAAARPAPAGGLARGVTLRSRIRAAKTGSRFRSSRRRPDRSAWMGMGGDSRRAAPPRRRRSRRSGFSARV